MIRTLTFLASGAALALSAATSSAYAGGAVAGFTITTGNYYYSYTVADSQPNPPQPAPPVNPVVFSTLASYPAGGPVTYTGISPLGVASATSSSIESPFSISATVSATPGAGILYPQFGPFANGNYASDSATAETAITFDISVVGTPGVALPVTLNALLQSSGTGPDPIWAFGPIWGRATGYAELAISDGLSDFGQVGFVGGGSPSGPGRGFDNYTFANCPFPGCTYSAVDNVNSTINLWSNTVYQVSEAVLVTAAAEQFSSIGVLSATASADPRFSISSTQAQMGYSLVTSPGFQSFTSVSSAPEPATWALMLAGLGGIGGAIRLTRRKVAVVAEGAVEWGEIA